MSVRSNLTVFVLILGAVTSTVGIVRAFQSNPESAPVHEKIPPGGFSGDGLFEVPENIRPGRYRTAGPATRNGDENCFWARLTGTSGRPADTRESGNSGGPVTVTVSADDVAFETSGCRPWIPTR